MAFGDGPHDAALRAAWTEFCARLQRAVERAFKDHNPASGPHRVDAFRFLTQNLGQAFDLALETRDTNYPVLHSFCGPTLKLGGDCADFTYQQAWIDGRSTYRITGTRGTSRFFDVTVQGRRTPGEGVLHEPFGDTPQANLFGQQLRVGADGRFELYVGGPERGHNWLPTTPESRKLFISQGFDSWDGAPAQLRIERVDMAVPKPLPTPGEMVEAMRWAGDFVTGLMSDWPEYPFRHGGVDAENPNTFPPGRRDRRRRQARPGRRQHVLGTGARRGADRRIRRPPRIVDVHQHGCLLQQHGLPVPPGQLHTEPHHCRRRRRDAGTLPRHSPPLRAVDTGARVENVTGVSEDELAGLSEFALLHENAEQAGVSGPLPKVARVESGSGDAKVNALRWGSTDPRIVFVHGGGQNAHTWDTVIVGVGEPALAVDLPGHGHSAWRADGDYSPLLNADALLPMLREHAAGADLVVGMSLGGLTAIRLGAVAPDLVKELVLIDVTPSALQRHSEMTKEQQGMVALMHGEREFDSFQAMLDLTIAAAPHREVKALRRGVFHNSRKLDNGKWTWRYDALRKFPDFDGLWADVDALSAPVTLVRGGSSGFVSDEDAAELSRRAKHFRTAHVVANSGHSVQSDQPRALIDILRGVLDAR